MVPSCGLRLLAGVGLVLSLLTTAAGAADPPANAALTYWPGFALLPRLEEKHWKILGDLETVKLDREADQLVRSAGQTLRFLHHGAAIPRCDWDLPYEDGFHMLLIHVDKGRTVGRLALLRARQRFERKEYRAGADDALATIALARHLAADRVIVTLLVQTAMEEQAIHLLARHLPSADAATRTAVRDRLDRLPPPGTLRAALETERSMVFRMRDALVALSKKPAVQFRKEAAALAEPYADTDAGKKLRTTITGLAEVSPAAITRLFQPSADYYDALVKLAELPPDEAVKRLTARQEAMKTDPVGGIFLPQMATVFHRVAQGKVRALLLRTGIEILEKGDAAAKAVRDPYGSGSVGYRTVSGGFELSSQLTVKGKPLTLRFGAPR
ncbi:MAG: hypothetical protein U0736_24040 [Gemmataceae bacterium]